MQQLAERLIYLMDCKEMKQTELADSIGISKQSLYKYLHCKCEPRAEIIARMAHVLDTTADYIVGLTDNPYPRDYDADKESRIHRETELLKNFRHLSADDKTRVEERIEVLLENYSK